LGFAADRFRSDVTFAAATLALSASMRSTAGAGSSVGSGTVISSPRIFASSSARRSRRYSLVSSVGSKSAESPSTIWRARSSSFSLTSVSSIASSISACE
jgi:hypothetical protein